MVGVPPYEGDPSPSTKPPATIVDLRPLFLRCVLTASSAIASARTVSSLSISIGGGGGGGGGGGVTVLGLRNDMAVSPCLMP